MSRVEHENWISNTDVAGPMCVSLLREEQALGRRTFYRMLVRSIFVGPMGMLRFARLNLCHRGQSRLSCVRRT